MQRAWRSCQAATNFNRSSLESCYPHKWHALGLAVRMNAEVMWKRVAGTVSAAVLLGVTGCATSTSYDRTAGERLDDRVLEGRVANALDNQPVYKYPHVEVNTFRGIVQLSGFVATEQQRQAAEEIATRVRGATEVENNIMVAPLEHNTLRDYIPGRDVAAERAQMTNNMNRGTAPRGTRTTVGSSTNGNTNLR
jgi:hypothetical protein